MNPVYSLVSLSQIRDEEFRLLSNSAFSDYLAGPFHLSQERFPDWIRVSGLDRSSSLVMQYGATSVGYLAVAQREQRLRIVGMGIVPEHRRKGLSRAFLSYLLSTDRIADLDAVELEVIENNLPALRLYESLGFQKLRRLYGFRSGELKLKCPGAHLWPISLNEAGQLLNHYDDLKLPWQASGWSVAKMKESHLAFAAPDGVCVLSGLDSEEVTVMALAVAPSRRNCGIGRSLVAALIECFPGKSWKVPILVPEEARSFFWNLGFHQQALTQFQMTKGIRAGV